MVRRNLPFVWLHKSPQNVRSACTAVFSLVVTAAAAAASRLGIKKIEAGNLVVRENGSYDKHILIRLHRMSNKRPRLLTHPVMFNFDPVPGTDGIIRGLVMNSKNNPEPSIAITGYNYKLTPECIRHKAVNLSHQGMIDIKFIDPDRHLLTGDFEEFWLKIWNEIIKEPSVISVKVPVLTDTGVKYVAMERNPASTLARMRRKVGIEHSDFAVDPVQALREGDEVMTVYKTELTNAQSSDYVFGENPPRIPLVGEKAREVMKTMIDCCLYLHKHNLGIKKIEAENLVVREKRSYDKHI